MSALRTHDASYRKARKEEGLSVEKLEVWHNEENLKMMEACDNGNCGGVPYFFNEESGKWICGGEDYEGLLAWAKGE